MGSTNHFSLDKFTADGRISDSNYKFSNRDRETIDSLLWKLYNHDHRETATVTLSGPDGPTLTLATTGGTLPPGVVYYYKISFVDEAGNETEASFAQSQGTPDPLSPPPLETLSTVTTGGSLDPGIYRYALSYYLSSGETTAPNFATINVPTGTSTNVNTITLAAPPTDATGWKLYRRGPNETDYSYLTTIVAGGTPPTTYDDTGSVTADCTVHRPTRNTTNSTNKMTIAVASGDIPLDSRIALWKIYRSSTIGVFGASSLLATVVETTTEGGTDLVTSYVDTGGGTFAGTPLLETVVPPPIPQLDASDIFASSSGRLDASVAPLGVQAFNFFCPGTLAAQSYNQFYLPHDMFIERLEAFYLIAPTGLTGANYLTLRLSDDATQNEIQSLWNNATEENEVQYVSNNATGGTFTLSDGINTTSALDFDITAVDLKTRLETDITAYIDITVAGTGSSTDPWVLTFVDPGNQDVDTIIANDSGLTGGTTTIITATTGSDGGTFTLSDGTNTTSAIAFNASAATIETRLETDITAYIAITVTGTGTESDPWLIEFVNPGSQNIDMMELNDSLLNGTLYVTESTKGYGTTQVDLVINTNQQYHYWQSSTTDYDEQEAEEAPATGGTSVSDAFATNDVAMELDTQNETNSWTLPALLDPGDYVARFYAADTDATATYLISVIDTPSTTVASLSVSDGSTYIPSHDLYFTSDGTETWKFETKKTDAGAGVVRIDKYEIEIVLPTLHALSTVTAEILITGTPSTNGDDLQVTAWH